MAKKDDKLDSSDSIATIEKSENTDERAEILERVRGYVIDGDTFQGLDYAWEGVVRLNKDVRISITSPIDGKKQTIGIKGNTDFECGIRILQQLVLKEVQESHPDKARSFKNTGKPRVENPLFITIIKESLSKNCPEAFLKFPKL